MIGPRLHFNCNRTQESIALCLGYRRRCLQQDMHFAIVERQHAFTVDGRSRCRAVQRAAAVAVAVAVPVAPIHLGLVGFSTSIKSPVCARHAGRIWIGCGLSALLRSPFRLDRLRWQLVKTSEECAHLLTAHTIMRGSVLRERAPSRPRSHPGQSHAENMLRPAQRIGQLARLVSCSSVLRRAACSPWLSGCASRTVCMIRLATSRGNSAASVISEQRSPKINFREIFRVFRFSTFTTKGNRRRCSAR